MKAAEGEKWREKLAANKDDEEHYLTYIKSKDNYTESGQYEWYRARGNQLYLDACFVLAIRCYTFCIELKPDIATSYANRAACYLKVFEVRLKEHKRCEIISRKFSFLLATKDIR